MAEIREYTFVSFVEKVLNPINGPKTVRHDSVQLKTDDNRTRIWRDMAYPETVVCQSKQDGTTVEYAWSQVISARLKPKPPEAPKAEQTQKR